MAMFPRYGGKPHLERLADDGITQRHTDYGRAGRPQVRYSWRARDRT